jgi:heme exporter protein C
MKMTNMAKLGLLAIGLVLLISAHYLVFLYVPTEATMGIVQRIFYVMLPMGWLAMLSSLIIFIGSIFYIRTRNDKWDALAYSAAEMGFLFATLTLLTGIMWAKPVWGVWWTWEPRLTATLVLWLIFLTYLTIQTVAIEPSRRALFAAVVGIVSFIDVPIIGMATTLWRGMHPGGIVFQGGLAPSMLLTLIVSLVAFTALYAIILIQRVALKNDQMTIDKLKTLRD